MRPFFVVVYHAAYGEVMMRFGIYFAAIYVALAVCSVAQAATLKTLYSFCSQKDCSDGYAPVSGLLRDHNGDLYGVTFYGGSASGFQGGGTAFELSPGRHSKWTLNTLHTFCRVGDACDSDGYFPQGTLIMDTAGNLYGGAAFGGAGEQGVIYKLSPADSNWNYTVLHTFTGPDGAVPSGGLRYVGFDAGALYDGVSALYGETQNFGGGIDGGTVYQLSPNSGSWTLATIHSFSPDDQNGYDPIQNVTLDANGANIYGVTSQPYGNVFRMTNTGSGVWNESTLFTFNPSSADGAYGPSAVYLDASGSLIGATGLGGPHCKHTKHHVTRCGGNVFNISGINSDLQYDVIHDFCSLDKLCEDGANGSGALVADASGNLYGVTLDGGSKGGGTIFRIRRGKKFEVLYSFCSLANCSDGANPDGTLTIDAKGHLYGVTDIGGANNGGTVFEFVP